MTDLSDIRSAVSAAAHALADGWPAEWLGTGPDQHTRLLRLHTPLGADVLLAERACITEGIGPQGPSPAMSIELLALSAQPALSPAELIGAPVLLELLTSHSRTELRAFHGHVLAFELLGSDGGLSRYRLRIGTWLDFLRHRTDAWVFQNQSVVDITESILNDYTGQGGLQPVWRWDLKDPAAYPRLSTFSQHAETDVDFLERLWAAHGLFYWFEHQGDAAGGGALGQHTLVIADHNGAFVPNAQPHMRFTQPGAVMKEDSLTRWHAVRRVEVSTLHTASHDYRCVGNHAGSADMDAAHDQPMSLVHADQPGAYAFETGEEAERLAMVQHESLQARRLRYKGQGTVRTLSPGTCIQVLEHAVTDASEGFVVLSVVHHVRNNLKADAKAGLQHLLGTTLDNIIGARRGAQPDNDSDAPMYEARFVAQPVAVPYRAPMQDEQGRLLHAKPTAPGMQTALVVGLDGPIHTDRDGRVKVQFHWQRGAGSSHRQSHPIGQDNAPASDASGTWVRVAQDWAGANWGGMFIPRLGQEVVVTFLEGDIDRPVIIGAAYNGEGGDNAQGNQVAGGAAQATGNAPAWFPGSQQQGEQQGHAHTATLSGFKSQSLDASQAGGGAYSQMVFDDSPGQGRVLAHTTQSQTWLQMGHLLQQHDNQRLASRGHGLELHTQAQGAVRAGSGLHVSTHARTGGSSSGQGHPTHTREAQSQLQAHADLLKALSGNAATHKAGLPSEALPDQLPAQQALQATLKSLQARQGSRDAEGEAVGADSAEAPAMPAIQGGLGSIPVMDRPDLVMSAAADISSATPAHTVIGAGQHTTVTSGQDAGLLSQRHMAWAVKDGISLFTRGEAKDSQRAVQEVGMKLHAASGNVNVQAQSDAFTLTAQKAIDVQSTAANVVINAPSRIVLNGGGGYIRIEGGDIEIGTNGPAQFKGGMKELTGGAGASSSAPRLAGAAALNLAHHLQYQAVGMDGKPLAHRSYVAIMADGSIKTGQTDAQGRTMRFMTDRRERVQIYIDDAEHHGFRLVPDNS
ncbi:MAG: type VI secretion system Vgr family protein [Aquabacterium sp.]